MKLFFKITINFIAAVILSLIVVPLTISLLLQNNFVQNYIVDYLAQAASQKVDTRIEIDRVYIKSIYNLQIQGLYVEDPIEKDTLLYASEVYARPSLFNPIEIASVKVNKGKVYLNTDSTRTLNLKHIFNKLKSKEKKPFLVNINDIELDSVDFEFRQYFMREVDYGVNIEDLRFNNLSVRASDFHMIRDSIAFTIDKGSFIEKSKLVIDNISSKLVTLTPQAISVYDGVIESGKTNLDIENLVLGYNEWNMSNFANNVSLKGKIDSSSVDFATIEMLSKKKRDWDVLMTMKGEFSGYVSDLETKIEMANIEGTTITNTTAKLKGLPIIESTNFGIAAENITTSPAQMNRIYNGFTGKNINAIQEVLGASSPLEFEGGFNGLFSNFTSSGKISSPNGQLELNVDLSPVALGYKIKGAVSSSGINVGRTLSLKNVGNSIFEAQIDGHISSDSVNIATWATVDLLEYNGYDYGNIEAKGDLVDKTFKGFLGSSDQNLDFAFNGLIDLSQSVPSYDFLLNVKNANLAKLNFNKRDSISQLSGDFKAYGQGSELDNLNADIDITKLEYINHLDTVKTGNITIKTRNNELSKSITLNSNFADLEIKAKDSFRHMLSYFTSTVRNYLPSLQESDLRTIVQGESTSSATRAQELEKDNNHFGLENYYVAKLNVKEANNVASIFKPGLEVAQGTTLSFLFNPRADVFSLSLTSKEIATENTTFADVNIDSRNHTDSISIFARIGEVFIGDYYVPNLSTIASVKNNNIELAARFRNSNDGSAGYIKSLSSISRDSLYQPVVGINIGESYFTLGKKMWRTNNSNVKLSSSVIAIDSLLIYSDTLQESLFIDGALSAVLSDSMHIRLKDVDLGAVNGLLGTLGYTVQGKLNGDAKIVKADQTVHSDIELLDLKVNEFDLGKTQIYSHGSAGVINFGLTNRDRTLISGRYYNDVGRFFSTAKIPNLELGILAPLMGTIADRVTGKGDIDVTIDNNNPLKRVSINGGVEVSDFTARLLFTNVTYRASGHIDVVDNQLSMTSGTIWDEVGGSSPISASLKTTYFKRAQYNISSNMTNMLCLNTTQTDNDLFYGRIFASGIVDIIGNGTQVTMNASARSANNSTFIMPLSDKIAFSSADFITYVSDKDIQTEKPLNFINRDKRKVTSKGSFGMNLSLDVRENTEIDIIVDPIAGDVVKGRGNGLLSIQAIPSENIFQINGSYEISNGSYLFTLQDIINKNFTIEPGSTISWSGDPLEANLGIMATYRVKASLAPLLGNSSSYAGRVPVDCNLSLGGQLLKPDINLGITVPNSDPETQSLISSALNTEEAVSMQLFWLLFGSTFYADGTTSTSNVNVGLMSSAVTGIDFLSSRISNWISSDKFDFGINYRPKTDMTSDEVELSLSTPILGNKLYLDIEGNYNAKNNTATAAMKTVSGDFYLTWVLDQSAKMKAKAFSRTITTFDENQGLQENGIGLYYKDSFDKFSELIARYRKAIIDMRNRRKSKKEFKKSKEQTASDN